MTQHLASATLDFHQSKAKQQRADIPNNFTQQQASCDLKYFTGGLHPIDIILDFYGSWLYIFSRNRSYSFFIVFLSHVSLLA